MNSHSYVREPLNVLTIFLFQGMKAENKHSKIIQAATKVFAKKGFYSARISDIAKVAKLARVALTDDELEQYGHQLENILERATTRPPAAMDGEASVFRMEDRNLLKRAAFGAPDDLKHIKGRLESTS